MAKKNASANKVAETKTPKKRASTARVLWTETPDGGYDVAVPEGFDFDKFRPLKKRDFTSEHLFYEHKAAQMDHKAAAFRAQGEEAKKLGSTKERAKAKRLIKMTEKMAELRKQLEAQGIDVDAVLATVKTDEKSDE